MPRSSSFRSALAHGLLSITASVCLPAAAIASQTDAPATSGDGVGPVVLNDAFAAVLVRIEGDGICSGTPITGTRFVVTAAHCVLDDEGNVGPRSITRDGVRYEAESVLVDLRYHDTPTNALDAAVLVMDREVAGPSATIGDHLPSTGTVTVAGLQTVDATGRLLRGDAPHDLPALRPASGAPIILGHEPAGCAVPVSSLESTATSVRVRCGLIPGASGGGLYVEVDGSVQLLAIVSTVSADVTSNGLTPGASLRELLDHSDRYTTSLAGLAVAVGVSITRS